MRLRRIFVVVVTAGLAAVALAARDRRDEVVPSPQAGAWRELSGPGLT